MPQEPPYSYIQETPLPEVQWTELPFSDDWDIVDKCYRIARGPVYLRIPVLSDVLDLIPDSFYDGAPNLRVGIADFFSALELWFCLILSPRDSIGALILREMMFSSLQMEN